MARRTSDVHRVLLVEEDARVLAALTAVIDATPGMQVAAATTSTVDAEVVAWTSGATVAVVDVDAGSREGELLAVRVLAAHVPVVAVCNGTRGGRHALAAGATTCCDKNGDPDAFTTAVAAAARTAVRRRAARDPGGAEADST